MRFLYCPRCEFRQFFLKNKNGDKVLVQVSHKYEIIPVKESENIEGYNQEELFYLGCSWVGTKKKLRKYLT